MWRDQLLFGQRFEARFGKAGCSYDGRVYNEQLATGGGGGAPPKKPQHKQQTNCAWYDAICKAKEAWLGRPHTSSW